LRQAIPTCGQFANHEAPLQNIRQHITHAIFIEIIGRPIDASIFKIQGYLKCPRDIIIKTIPKSALILKLRSNNKNYA
jgi:hypothetical protein